MTLRHLYRHLKDLIEQTPDINADECAVLVASDPECNSWNHLGTVDDSDDISWEESRTINAGPSLRLDTKGGQCILLIPGYSK